MLKNIDNLKDQMYKYGLKNDKNRHIKHLTNVQQEKKTKY